MNTQFSDSEAEMKMAALPLSALETSIDNIVERRPMSNIYRRHWTTTEQRDNPPEINLQISMVG